MSVLQSMAVLVLWRSGHFDSLDIASLLGTAEADVMRVIHAVREREFA